FAIIQVCHTLSRKIIATVNEGRCTLSLRVHPNHHLRLNFLMGSQTSQGMPLASLHTVTVLGQKRKEMNLVHTHTADIMNFIEVFNKESRVHRLPFGRGG